MFVVVETLSGQLKDQSAEEGIERFELLQGRLRQSLCGQNESEKSSTLPTRFKQEILNCL